MYYKVKGSGRHYPEIVRKIKNITDTIIECEEVGYLVHGHLEIHSGGRPARKYLKIENMETYE